MEVGNVQVGGGKIEHLLQRLETVQSKLNNAARVPGADGQPPPTEGASIADLQERVKAIKERHTRRSSLIADLTNQNIPVSVAENVRGRNMDSSRSGRGARRPRSGSQNRQNQDSAPKTRAQMDEEHTRGLLLPSISNGHAKEDQTRPALPSSGRSGRSLLIQRAATASEGQARATPAQNSQGLGKLPWSPISTDIKTQDYVPSPEEQAAMMNQMMTQMQQMMTMQQQQQSTGGSEQQVQPVQFQPQMMQQMFSQMAQQFASGKQQNGCTPGTAWANPVPHSVPHSPERGRPTQSTYQRQVSLSHEPIRTGMRREEGVPLCGSRSGTPASRKMANFKVEKIDGHLSRSRKVLHPLRPNGGRLIRKDTSPQTSRSENGVTLVPSAPKRPSSSGRRSSLPESGGTSRAMKVEQQQKGCPDSLFGKEDQPLQLSVKPPMLKLGSSEMIDRENMEVPKTPLLEMQRKLVSADAKKLAFQNFQHLFMTRNTRMLGRGWRQWRLHAGLSLLAGKPSKVVAAKHAVGIVHQLSKSMESSRSKDLDHSGSDARGSAQKQGSFVDHAKKVASSVSPKSPKMAQVADDAMHEMMANKHVWG